MTLSELLLKPYPTDADGIVIPELWQLRPDKWAKLPRKFREEHSQFFLAEQAKPKKPEKVKRPGVTRFSTDYCIEWGRKQGWKLLDRERYDARTKRHHDLMLGADAMMETDTGIVLVQGAGRSERKEHRKRFEERGGVVKCMKLHMRFVYVEFDRGNKTPVVEEWWS